MNVSGEVATMLYRLATVLLALFMAPAVPAQTWTHSVRDFPTEAVEGKPIRFKVAYTAPEPVQLHAELKDTSNVVHTAQVLTVSGTGVADFRIVVPEGKLRGQLLVAVWMGEDWRSPKGAITHAGPIPVYTAEEGRRLEEAVRKGEAMRKRLGLDPRRPVAAILSGGWARRDAALANRYRRTFADTGMRCIALGPDEIAAPGVLDPAAVRLLVIPEAQTFPGEALIMLERYLRKGGNLMVLGAPAFDRLVRQLPGEHGAEWVDDREMADRLRKLPAHRRLLNMAALSKDSWSRSANDMGTATTWTMENSGPEGGPALRHDIRGLSGWDTLQAPLDQPAGAGDNIILFRAKGKGQTSALSVELRERDGSRWIAVVPLTDHWQSYAVPAADFKLWDPDGKSGRGSAGDRLNLQAIASVAVGLAFTHTSVPGGDHTYWFADLASAQGPELRAYSAPILDTISPDYKLYTIRGAQRLDASAGRLLVGVPAPALPRNILSTHPRPLGTGFDKQRKYRWIPLLQVMGKPGVMGTIATLVHHVTGPFAGGTWASFTVPDTEWYSRADVIRYVTSVGRAMLGSPPLIEAGAQFYGYFPDEKPILGARAVAAAAGQSVRFTVRDLQYGPARCNPKVVFQESVKLARRGGEAVAQVRWAPNRLMASRYRVTVTLLREGKPVDVLEHEITVRHPCGTPGGVGRPTTFVRVDRGQFSLNGKPWYPHGVNYMPSSGIAAEDGHYFEQWLSSESYDPLVVDRDLRRVRDIGFNMVSAFIYTESTHNHNLVDFLNRCDAYGLRVNLSLRPGTPLDFQWPDIGEIIKANRLADDPTVFAYDLAWEPAWGYRDQRRRWDPEWREWIQQRYGSIENAEKDWGEKAPRENGEVAGPSDADVTAASTIPHVVAAYRRFQDDFLSRKHMEARQKIRSLDTRHLLSFRMSVAGDPTCGPTIMPYDFMGLARSMDFMSPEGYGRIGDWERVKPGWFTAAYARYAAPGRPVMWAEFGYTIWNKGQAVEPEPGLSFADAFDRRHYQPGTIAFTEQFYRDFYEMALASGSSGTVCWWYPGGFRVGENSDFGIINPDGTWRGITGIIAEYARKFANRPAPREPDAVIRVDRDRHPDGIYGIYNEVKDEFWRLVAEGQFPALEDEATHTTSANCPLIAVGNLPYNGSNPPKYLNAEFEYLRVQDATGAWVDVPYGGGTITLESAELFKWRLCVGNNGRVAWPLPIVGTGSVEVRVTIGPRGLSFSAILPQDVPPLGAVEVAGGYLTNPTLTTDFTFTLEATDRCRFGEVRRVRVIFK